MSSSCRLLFAASLWKWLPDARCSSQRAVLQWHLVDGVPQVTAHGLHSLGSTLTELDEVVHENIGVSQGLRQGPVGWWGHFLLEEMPSHIRLGITQYHLLDSLDRSRDNKQQELTSLILETPLPQRDSCNRLYRTVRSVGKQANRLFVQHNIKEVNRSRLRSSIATTARRSR